MSENEPPNISVFRLKNRLKGFTDIYSGPAKIIDAVPRIEEKLRIEAETLTEQRAIAVELFPSLLGRGTPTNTFKELVRRARDVKTSEDPQVVAVSAYSSGNRVEVENIGIGRAEKEITGLIEYYNHLSYQTIWRTETVDTPALEIMFDTTGSILHHFLKIYPMRHLIHYARYSDDENTNNDVIGDFIYQDRRMITLPLPDRLFLKDQPFGVHFNRLRISNDLISVDIQSTDYKPPTLRLPLSLKR
ncbi:MAG: hypothetical protein ABIO02_04445 [Patescibacteria group bacterium]